MKRAIYIALLSIIALAILTIAAWLLRADLLTKDQPDTARPSNAGQTPSLSNGPWISSEIDTKLPGLSPFRLSYPASLGDPENLYNITDSVSIDLDKNVATLVFYKPGSPRDYPSAGAETNLTIGVSVGTLKPEQTLEDFASGQILASDEVQESYKLIIGDRTIIANKLSSTSPITFYYLEPSSGTVVRLTFARRNVGDSVQEISSSEQESRLLEDNIVRSIIFGTQ